MLFILTDDQRYDVLSCMGHPHLRTPHIDRLASEGLLLEITSAPQASALQVELPF